VRSFFLIILGVIFLANFVSWFALDSILNLLIAPKVLHRLWGGFILFQVAGMAAVIGGRLLGHQPGTGMGRPLLSLFMIWNMLLALPTALLSMIWAGTLWMMGSANGDSDPESPWRTVGLIAALLPIAIALIATAIALWQLNRFRVRRLKLTIPHLPETLKGFTIAHLSDFHIGKLTRGKVLDEIVATTNRLDVDLILVTGDSINMALEDLPKAFELFRAMKSRHGLFVCEGNHDLIENHLGFESAVESSGLPFLLNQSAMISVNGQAVQIIGLRWGEGMGRSHESISSLWDDALQRLLAMRSPGDFTILLAHHPAAFDAAAAAGIPLTLAGHTHGGQLMLTPTIGFGPWLYRYWSGLYQKGESQLVVSNGTGNWFPLRINAPAEIIHLTLA